MSAAIPITAKTNHLRSYRTHAALDAVMD